MSLPLPHVPAPLKGMSGARLGIALCLQSHDCKGVATESRTLVARWPPLHFAPNPTQTFSGGCSICQGAE